VVMRELQSGAASRLRDLEDDPQRSETTEIEDGESDDHLGTLSIPTTSAPQSQRASLVQSRVGDGRIHLQDLRRVRIRQRSSGWSQGVSLPSVPHKNGQGLQWGEEHLVEVPDRNEQERLSLSCIVAFDHQKKMQDGHVVVQTCIGLHRNVLFK